MHNNDEIDLIELFIKSIQFIKQKFKFIASTAIIGALIGILFYFVQPSNYTSILYGYAPLVNSEVIENSIKNLNKEIQRDNIMLYTNHLKEIKRIDISISDENYLELSIRSKSRINIDSVNSFINKYLMMNVYISKKNDLRKKQLQNTIAVLNKEVDKINNNLIDSKDENTITSICSERNKLEEELVFLKPLTVTNKIANINSQINILYSAIISCSVFLFLLLVFYILKKVNSLVEINKKKEYEIPKMRKTA